MQMEGGKVGAWKEKYTRKSIEEEMEKRKGQRMRKEKSMTPEDHTLKTSYSDKISFQIPCNNLVLIKKKILRLLG